MQKRKKYLDLPWRIFIWKDTRQKLSIKIINMSTGETVLDTQIRGMKISDGKLYYLTTDNELESIDIEL